MKPPRHSRGGFFQSFTSSQQPLMTCSILSIGDELLIGQVVNTNASWLGDQLTALGVAVVAINTIGDGRETIAQEIQRLAATSDLLMISGGLGPTHDDLTREAICDLLGCGLRVDEDQLRRIEQRFAERGLQLNERSIRQASVPEACRTLVNNYGSAPGLAFTIGSCRAYALPGVPSELKGIFTEEITPEIASEARAIDRQTFLIFGPAESALADSLQGLNALLGNGVSLAYLPSFGGIRLRAMRNGSGADTRQRFQQLVEGIATLAAKWIVSDRDETMAEAVGRLLAERGLTLSVAESCTGGTVGMMLTEAPGSSSYFLGGIISYANSLKREMLGVAESDLREHGAVSQQVAVAMARGVRERTGSDLAVAVTGIAGPDGGSAEKPVGTVWIAAVSSGQTMVERFQLGRERNVVRTRAANIALNLVRRLVVEGG